MFVELDGNDNHIYEVEDDSYSLAYEPELPDRQVNCTTPPTNPHDNVHVDEAKEKEQEYANAAAIER